MVWPGAKCMILKHREEKWVHLYVFKIIDVTFKNIVLLFGGSQSMARRPLLGPKTPTNRDKVKHVIDVTYIIALLISDENNCGSQPRSTTSVWPGPTSEHVWYVSDTASR